VRQLRHSEQEAAGGRGEQERPPGPVRSLHARSLPTERRDVQDLQAEQSPLPPVVRSQCADVRAKAVPGVRSTRSRARRSPVRRTQPVLSFLVEDHLPAIPDGEAVRLRVARLRDWFGRAGNFASARSRAAMRSARTASTSSGTAAARRVRHSTRSASGGLCTLAQPELVQHPLHLDIPDDVADEREQEP